MKRLVLTLLLALPAAAQVVTDTPRGVVVARDGRVELQGGWAVDGVREATELVASETHVALLDALHDEVLLIELATGRSTRTKTAATPIAGAFAGGTLYVLARDANVLQRIGGGNIAVSGDFLRAAGDKLYVYDRISGVLSEIEGDRVTRQVIAAPFASDLERDGDTAYLVYPREARIRTIDLNAMKTAESIDVGAVPVDLALTGGGTALTARVLAVADPSAKRIWLTEGRQSTAKAFARGFLRGFLGLGLYGNRSSQFPTGVDRVVARGGRWIAYDSSSRTLYRVDRRKSSVIAKGVAPQGFTLTETGVAYWLDGQLRTGTSVAETKAQ